VIPFVVFLKYGLWLRSVVAAMKYWKMAVCMLQDDENEQRCSSVFIFACYTFTRAVKALLEHGANPNMGDEFSNVHVVAREKQLHSLHGMWLYDTILLNYLTVVA
jgi:hypothetical protein